MRYLRWCRRSALGTVSAMTLVVSAACVPVASAAVPPSLRLFGSARRVTVTQNDLRYGTADLGLWVASVNGGFQIDVKRPGYGAWTASQVDSSTAAALRSVPARLVDPIRGLRRFLSVQFVDARGRVAARRQVTFCPDGQASRVNDSGPLNSTYLNFCQGFTSFPFVRGAVWGIDTGWAVPPVLGSGSVSGFPIGALPPGPLPPGLLPPIRGGWVSLTPGRYTAIVSITRQYQKLFGIAAEQAAAKVGMRVLYSPPPRVRPPATPPRSTKPEDAGDTGRLQVVPTVTAPDPASMPNLVAAPAWGIAMRRQGGSVGGPVPTSEPADALAGHSVTS